MEWLPSVILCSALVWFMRGVRVWIACPSASLSLSVFAVAMQNALLRVSPMRLGELGLPYLLHRYGRISIGEGLLILTWVRLTEVACLGLFTLWALYEWTRGAGGDASLAQEGLSAWSTSLWSLVALTLLMAASARPLSLWVARAVETRISVPLDREAHLQMSRFKRTLAQGASALTQVAALSPLRALSLVALSALIMVGQYGLFYTLLRCCHIEVGLYALIIGSGGAHLAGALPLPTIGNIGSHETGWVLSFVAMGVSANDAGVSAALSQWLTLLLAGLWALFSLWGLHQHLPKPYDDEA
jgi:hypothetical protein